MTEYRYRYVDVIHDPEGVTVCLRKYAVVRKTPKGAWVTRRAYMPWMKLDEMPKSSLRFVLDGPGKRYCHDTLQHTWSAFKHRKIRQLDIAELQAKRAKWALRAIKELDDAPDSEWSHVKDPEVCEVYTTDW